MVKKKHVNINIFLSVLTFLVIIFLEALNTIPFLGAFYSSLIVGLTFTIFSVINTHDVFRRIINLLFLAIFFSLGVIHILKDQFPEVYAFWIDDLWGYTILLVLGLTALFRLYRVLDFPPSHSQKSGLSEKSSFHEKKISRAIPVIGGIIFIFLGGYQLGSFITVDEPRWVNYFDVDRIKSPESLEEARNSDFISSSYGRSVAYWNSYFSGDLKSAMTNGVSGATTNVLHVVAYFFQDVSLETYLFLSRTTFVIHNLFFIGLAAYLVGRLISYRHALFFFSITILFPLVVGYSRIVNHDSINGVYIITFFLAFLLALRERSRKWALWGGVLSGLAVATSGKGHYIIPFLWLTPLSVALIYNFSVRSAIFNMFNVFPAYLLGGVASILLLVPATLFYPQLFYESFIMPDGLLFWGSFATFTVFIFSATHDTSMEKFRNFLITNQSWLVRIITLFLGGGLGVVMFSIFETENISVLLTGEFSFIGAIQSSTLYWFFAQPLIIIVFLGLWVMTYIIRPRFDISFVSMIIFAFLFVMGIGYTSAVTDKEVFITLNTRYLMVFLYFYLLALGTAGWIHYVSDKAFISCTMAVIVVLTWNNISSAPYYTLFNNGLFPSGKILYPSSWGFGVHKTANFINKNFSNTLVYDSSGRMGPFLHSDNKAIGWSTKYWNHPTEFIALFHRVDNHKNHPLSDRFSFYRENKTPIWEYTIDGAPLVELYRKVPSDQLPDSLKKRRSEK